MQAEGEDSLKKMQLMELAILNGTYRDANIKSRKSYSAVELFICVQEFKFFICQIEAVKMCSSSFCHSHILYPFQISLVLTEYFLYLPHVYYLAFQSMHISVHILYSLI